MYKDQFQAPLIVEAAEIRKVFPEIRKVFPRQYQGQKSRDQIKS